MLTGLNTDINIYINWIEYGRKPLILTGLNMDVNIDVNWIEYGHKHQC